MISTAAWTSICIIAATTTACRPYSYLMHYVITRAAQLDSHVNCVIPTAGCLGSLVEYVATAADLGGGIVSVACTATWSSPELLGRVAIATHLSPRIEWRSVAAHGIHACLGYYSTITAKTSSRVEMVIATNARSKTPDLAAMSGLQLLSCS